MNPEVLLSRIRVVLCRPSHPGNIGAAARAMKTMGLTDLRLVAPRTFPDPEADARATGAVDVLERAKVNASLAEALAGTVMTIALSARRRDLGPPPVAPREVVVRLLAEAAQGEVVSAANMNSPDQIVIAGHAGAVARASELAKAAGAKRAVPLPVSAPFHCALMKPAQEALAKDLEATAFADLAMPLVNNWAAEIFLASWLYGTAANITSRS